MVIANFTGAIEEAQRKLTTIEASISQLERERETLQTIIASLRAYLSIEPQNAESNDDTHSDKKNDLQKMQPTWSYARDIILDFNRPANIPEIHAAFLQRGIRAGKDSIRMSILRKPQIFKSFGGGFYGLVEIDNAIKEKGATEVAP